MYDIPFHIKIHEWQYGCEKPLFHVVSLLGYCDFMLEMWHGTAWTEIS